MTLLGIVRTTFVDKAGLPIARVQPLFEVSKADWRDVEARRDFPTQGLVFWPAAREARENALVFFRAEDNGQGQKDEYRASDVQSPNEVVDLRTLGGPNEVRNALTAGLRTSGFIGGRVFLRCSPDILVGPVKLQRTPTGLVTFDVAHRDRIPCFPSANADIRTISDGRYQRMLLSNGPTPAPTGFVDWDEDRLILRRALTAAIERAKRTGADPGLTRRLIEEAADAVADSGGGPELSLERYRLERAKALCADNAATRDLGDVLLNHPALTSSLEEARTLLRGQMESTVRAEVEASFTARRAEVEQLSSEALRIRSELATQTAAVASAERRASEARQLADQKVADVEEQVAQRIASALGTPSELLAQVALLRPFLSSAAAPEQRNARTVQSSYQPQWRPAKTHLADQLALQRALSSAFKARGLSPASTIRLHCAIVSRLMPVLTGGAGLTALAAYAHAACGGRLSILHVSPAFMKPTDLFGSFRDDGDFWPHAQGLLSANGAAGAISALSLFVCEGLNRGPTESYLAPFLQLQASGIDVRVPTGEAAQEPYVQADGLRLAATSIEGATALPTCRALWRHAVAVNVESGPRAESPASAEPSEIALGSDLLAIGDVPRDIVDELLEVAPAARDSRDALERFGAALSRYETDRSRIQDALIECVLLPVVVLAGDEERAGMLEALKQHLGQSEDAESKLVALERRLRQTLA